MSAKHWPCYKSHRKQYRKGMDMGQYFQPIFSQFRHENSYNKWEDWNQTLLSFVDTLSLTPKGSPWLLTAQFPIGGSNVPLTPDSLRNMLEINLRIQLAKKPTIFRLSLVTRSFSHIHAFAMALGKGSSNVHASNFLISNHSGPFVLAFSFHWNCVGNKLRLEFEAEASFIK